MLSHFSFANRWKTLHKRVSPAHANLFTCVFGKQSLILNYFAYRIKLKILSHIVQMFPRKSLSVHHVFEFKHEKHEDDCLIRHN